MNVTLGWFEILQAALVGVHRQIESIKGERQNQHGCAGDNDWQLHIEGACGEMAYAKARQRYWNGSVNTFQTGGDVGAVQVRTRSRDNYDLIVRRNDRDSDAFVLVVGKSGKYRVVGWIYGRDAKRDEWLKTYGDREPAYFVPQSALNCFPAAVQAA